jgi:hypothetical protein
MPSEGRRYLVRITSNYGRLLATFCMGLLLVRVLLQALGSEAWGLIALMGSTIGLTAMLGEIVNKSMIRELGAAFHAERTGERPGWFVPVYNSALLVALGVALLSTLVMAGIWLAVPLLDVPDHLVVAARWLVVWKAVEGFTRIALAPPANMFVVTERMVTYNVVFTLDRASFLTGALIVAYVVQPEDVARGVIVFAIISSSLVTTLKIVQAFAYMALDRRAVPAPRTASREALSAIARIGGWNTATVVALTLHIPVAAVLMNLFFGLVMGNLVFGLASQLSGYVRMVSTGMTDGLDAVSARMSAGGTSDQLRRLVLNATRVHGLAVLPAALVVLVLAEPLLLIWVGERITDPATTVPPTVTLVRVLTLGVVCRSIGDGWISVLYGAGHIRRYAPMMLATGLAHPVVALALLLVLPDDRSLVGRFTGPAWSYTIICFLLFLVWIPWHLSRVLETSMGTVLRPLVRPLVVTAASAPVLVLLMRGDDDWTLLRLAWVTGIWGAATGVLVAGFGVSTAQRQRLLAALRRRPARDG